TYYVDTNHPSASDSNPGTEVLPWKTIQKPANMLVAGDTVYIKQGTYTATTPTIQLKNSGTASGSITYSAYPGHENKAILNGAGIEMIGKSYIKVSGLRIQNALKANGFHVVGPGSQFTISGNDTYNTLGSGIGVYGNSDFSKPSDSVLTDIILENNKIEKANEGGYAENITIANGVDRFEVRGNELFNPADNENLGGEGIDVKSGVQNGKIHHNIITGPTRDRTAIYVDAFDRYVKNVEVFNNIVYDTNTAGIIVAFERPGGVVDNIKIYNNVLYGNGLGGVAVHDFGYTNGTINNISVMNNTIYGNGHKVGHHARGIWVNTQIATNMVIRNNIVYKNEDTFYLNNPGIVVDHNLTTDPQFINEAAKDFHLKSTSPAVNTGSSVSAPTTDYDGVSRPQGSAFDIGAYEF
ncbi:MAG: choice-of-anchor Q domain-containing protein, partial [Gammaproteobacteria bacterium]